MWKTSEKFDTVISVWRTKRMNEKNEQPNIISIKGHLLNIYFPLNEYTIIIIISISSEHNEEEEEEKKERSQEQREP